MEDLLFSPHRDVAQSGSVHVWGAWSQVQILSSHLLEGFGSDRSLFFAVAMTLYQSQVFSDACHVPMRSSMQQCPINKSLLFEFGKKSIFALINGAKMQV